MIIFRECLQPKNLNNTGVIMIAKNSIASKIFRGASVLEKMTSKQTSSREIAQKMRYESLDLRSNVN